MTVSVLQTVSNASVFPMPWNGEDRSTFLRLDLSESLASPSLNVREAISSLAASSFFTSYPNEIAFYPLLAQYTGVAPSQHLLTNGSDHAIQIVLRAFLRPGDLVLISEPTFPMYAHVARTLGGNTTSVPLGVDMVFDVDAYISGFCDRVRLLVLVNPNNPTGTDMQILDIRIILAAYPNIPVVVDEAYFEYSGNTAVSLLSEYDNLIILRSFSKAFGLAGLRLGYLLSAAETVQELWKLRQPFDVNSFALVAAAENLRDLSDMRRYVREIMTESKPMVEEFLYDRGIPFFPSRGNFILARLPQRDRIVEGLKREGVLVAPQRHPMIGDSVRIGIGPFSTMKEFLRIFATLLDGEKIECR
jgi:histidinol-phosphate aminotransferase